MSSDEEKTTRQREGWTRVFFKGGLDNIDFKFSERDRIRDAWKKGEAFIAAADVVGAEMDLKLGEVVAIAKITPEQCALTEAEDEILDRQRRSKNLLNGDT